MEDTKETDNLNASNTEDAVMI